jgi:hypothetical protein
MRGLWLLRVFALFGWLCLAAPGGVVAQTYDAQVKELATALVNQMEAARQRSGTVLDFTDLQGAATELGRFLAQELSDQLVSSSSQVSFVDRANLQYLLRENKLSTEGLVNPQSSRKLGNLIGIDTVLFGTVTPIGTKSIRLSVRAVAIETGKIVVARSVTLTMSDDIAAMYTRGVASGGSGVESSNSAPRPPDVRERFRADSIKVSGRFTGQDYAGALAVTFTIENRSGISFGLGVVTHSTSLGPCLLMSLSGLPYFGDYSGFDVNRFKSNPDNKRKLLYVPVNGKATASAVFFGSCQIRAGSTQDLSSTLIISVENEIFTFPASASIVMGQPSRQ